MVDTHAHLGLCESGTEELVASARQAGVRRILTVGLDEQTNSEAIADAERHDEVFASVGRHPNSATGFDRAAAESIEQLAAHPRVRAIGETGLDLYRERASLDAQREAFAAQIEIARRAGLPLVIHMRDPEGSAEASDEALATLAERAEGVGVILHCFSAAPSKVETAAEHGWCCSFAGNVTYPKAEALREAARLVPDELLLVETDSPYLAPQPVRGKPNQPANVVATAELVAAERGVAPPELEALVEANAARVFKW
ncbi:MAG: TatD family hydrolase [Solirubrobacterales bacterium]